MQRRAPLLAVIVALALVLPAAGPSNEPMITNGRDASPSEHPFTVSLQTPGFGHFCGGSLIAPEWVLTAAHCAGIPTEAVIGAHDLRADDGTRVSVIDEIVHPDYDAREERNDIALLRLATAVTTVEPLRLATTADATALEAPGRIVTLTGWGGTSNDPSVDAVPDVLQVGRVPVLAEGSCSGPGFGSYDAATQVCAGAPEQDADGGVDACQGDSGGPLFATDAGHRVQIGIVSYGPTCGHTPTAYTQVSAFTDFLELGTGMPIDPLFPSEAERVSGPNRYATAAAFAGRGWDAPVPVMYVVTGAAFADALAVAPLAKDDRAPVVLTASETLPPETFRIITSLRPARVVIVGGTGAVSTAVANEITGITGKEPERIAGADRYATAALVAEQVVTGRLAPGFEWVFVAGGEGFADALGGAAAAAADPTTPLLLTTRDALPAETLRVVEETAPTTVIVLGGTAAVSDAVVDELAALGPDVVRIAGNDRYETAAILAETIFETAEEVLVASGTAFPDGLVAGSAGRPLLLVPPAGTTVPSRVVHAVATLGTQHVVVMGGVGAVSDGQARTMQEAAP